MPEATMVPRIQIQVQIRLLIESRNELMEYRRMENARDQDRTPGDRPMKLRATEGRRNGGRDRLLVTLQ